MLGKIIESVTDHLCAGQRNSEDSGRVGWQFTGASGDSDTPPLSDSHKYRQGGKNSGKPQSWPLEPL